jgi:hypothetical protein
MTKSESATRAVALAQKVQGAYLAAEAHAEAFGYTKPFDRLTSLLVALDHAGLTITTKRGA